MMQALLRSLLAPPPPPLPNATPPTLDGHSTALVTATSQLSISLPKAPGAGNFLLAFIRTYTSTEPYVYDESDAWDALGTSMTIASGSGAAGEAHTLLSLWSDRIPDPEAGTGGDDAEPVYMPEPNVHPFTIVASGGRAAGVLCRFGGVHPSTPVHRFTSRDRKDQKPPEVTTASVTGSEIWTPSIKTRFPGCLIVHAWGSRRSSINTNPDSSSYLQGTYDPSLNLPAGVTKVAEVFATSGTNNANLTVGIEILQQPGVLPERMATLNQGFAGTNVVAGRNAWTVALRPAVAW